MAGTPRPTGVAVLSILAAIGGILCIIGAAALGILAGAMEELIETILIEYGSGLIPGASEFIAAMVMVIAAVAAIFGILYLIAAYGLWTGMGWAWWLTIILSILGIIGGILSLPGGIITIIIDILIIYYFTRPHVKEFFGMGVQRPPPTPPS